MKAPGSRPTWAWMARSTSRICYFFDQPLLAGIDVPEKKVAQAQQLGEDRRRHGDDRQAVLQGLGDDVDDDGIDALGVLCAQQFPARLGDVVVGDDAGALGVVDVVVDVGDHVGQAHDLALEGERQQLAVLGE